MVDQSERAGAGPSAALRTVASRFRTITLGIILLAAPAIGLASEDPSRQSHGAVAASVSGNNGSTSDHRSYEVLQEDFESGSEVTQACLTCHVNAAKQIQATEHWNWEYANPKTGQMLGKRHVVNNYYISALANLPTCTVCHVSYDWEETGFEFESEENVDCLVCHDGTGVYRKIKFHSSGRPCLICHDVFPEGSRFPEIGLTEVAQNVGLPRRENCGTCHFRGGGGDAVKHGDMDSSLTNPPRSLDVHMDANGLNFVCTTCHSTDQHAVKGSRYSPEASDTKGFRIPANRPDERGTCQSCHGLAPHPKDAKLNDHTDRVACQTCHIPAFARGGIATKTWWDWSTAGKQTPDGKNMVKIGPFDRPVYTTEKGDFGWAMNVTPKYVWFDGRIEYTLINDKIDPTRRVIINTFLGGPDEPEARIWPVKSFRGKQPYDMVNKTLAVPELAGRDENAFWRNFDWNKAVAAGMKAVGAPYSGKLGFVETEMLWPINHMVAPAEDALKCDACHAEKGRLDGVSGFYMPGRHLYPLIDKIGGALLGLTLSGVAIHAMLRVYTRRRRRERT